MKRKHKHSVMIAAEIARLEAIEAAERRCQAEILFAKRSAAAKRGAETLRLRRAAKQAAKQAAHAKRCEAARRGAETKRMRRLDRQTITVGQRVIEPVTALVEQRLVA